MAETFIQNTFVGQICDKVGAGRIISVEEHRTVADTLNVFAKYKIISAPVIREDGAALGVVHLIDIVCYLANSLDLSVAIKNLLGLSQESKSVAAFEPTDRMSLLIRTLGSRQHHLALVTGKNIRCVLTQTDIVRFLWDNLGYFKQVSSTPIGRLKIGVRRATKIESGKEDKKSNLITLANTSTVKQGFKVMAQNDFDSLPITRSGTYEMMGVLRSKDLTSDLVRSAKSKENLEELFNMNVMDFIRNARGQDKQQGLVSDFDFVSCSMEDTFEKVMERIASKASLQAWIIQPLKGNFEVIGVITLSDIISAFDESCK